jgi:hypothetical protein
MKSSLLCTKSFSKGKICVLMKRGEVWANDLDLVMILMAFFWSKETLFSED